MHVEHEHHHGRAGANEQRVDVDRKALDQTLLNRVRNACSSRGVRSGTHAGFVGVQAALDAEHNDRASKTAEDRLEIERRREHKAEHRGELADIAHGSPHSNRDVNERHNRNNDRGDDADALRAAKDDDGGHSRKHDTARDGGLRRHFAVAGVIRQRARSIERLQAVEAEREAQDEQHGEHHAQPALAQTLLDVISRAATKFAVFAANLEDLRQSRFDECRRGADNRHKPHPEHSTRAARGDCGCNAGDVARANAARSGHHERLERRDGMLAANMLLLGELGEHVFDVANLHGLGTNGVPNARCHKQRQQDVGIHEAVDFACDINEECVDVHVGPFFAMERN